MKFRYRAYSDSVETGAKWTFYRPVVAILLRRSHATVRKVGLVDTGADLTLLPMSVSEALGVQLDSRHAIQVAGVGDSTVAAIPGELEFELRRKQESCSWKERVYFADQDYVLLGNEGFLEFFVATFDWADKSLHLVPNSRMGSTVSRH